MAYVALIVAYGRKSNVLRLIDVIARAGIKRIYISLDGPRNESLKKIQSELRLELEFLSREHPCEIIVWQREINLGSGASVISSLDWVFAVEEEVCVLEDDLVVDGKFFEFIKFGLELMNGGDPNLKMVTGTNPFENATNGILGKLSYPVAWGWATNKSNWNSLRGLIFSETTTRIPLRRLSRNLYWRTGKRRALSGQIEAWDVPLAAEMHKTNFYTLVPPKNLVQNIGFDGFAAHTDEDRWPLDMKISNTFSLDEIKNNSGEYLNLNQNFEKRIFKIRYYHAASWLVNIVVDQIRFSQKTINLKKRTQLEVYLKS